MNSWQPHLMMNRHTNNLFRAGLLLLLILSSRAEAQVPIPRGRRQLNAARTTFVADNGRLLRGPYESTEWTTAAPAANVAQMKELGFNAVHLYAEVFDPNYPNPGSTAPRLSITTALTAITLHWPLASAGYTVQSRTNLSHGNWANLTSPTPQIVVGEWQVTVPTTANAPSTFYRLAR